MKRVTSLFCILLAAVISGACWNTGGGNQLGFIFDAFKRGEPAQVERETPPEAEPYQEEINEVFDELTDLQEELQDVFSEDVEDIQDELTDIKDELVSDLSEDLADLKEELKDIHEEVFGEVKEEIREEVNDFLDYLLGDTSGGGSEDIQESLDDVMYSIGDLLDRIEDRCSDLDGDEITRSRLRKLISAANAVGASCEKLEKAVAGKSSGKLHLDATGDTETDCDNLCDMIELIVDRFDKVDKLVAKDKVKEGQARAAKDAANELLSECQKTMRAL